ncbi:MAG: DUF971 domain-containing protein [Piscirickettsiaceae bacterium]|nr:DUF971 domain-containing protein [Piscirickettsiaceae bacterium]
MKDSNIPSEISLHKKSNVLEVSYNEDKYCLLAEYLRVYSPSAEVMGHNHGQAILQTSKEYVGINQIENIGHYAIKIYFDDGHNSGLFTWDYLHQLAKKQKNNWQLYLERLKQAGYQRKK